MQPCTVNVNLHSHYASVLFIKMNWQINGIFEISMSLQQLIDQATMGRGSGRSTSRGRSSSPAPPTRNTNAATKPMPTQQTPFQQPAQSSGGMLGGIGSTIMTGMAFGAGSEVAHQAVKSFMGGSSSHSEQQQPQQQAQSGQQAQQNPCQTESYNLSNCLSTNDNIQYCQNFSDMLKSCRQNNSLL